MINKVHNIDFLKNEIEDKSVHLIIADPPYFQVRGDFDFIWKTFEDYLQDVEKWAIECKRVLRDNGSIIWYGDAKNIAYTQIIFDKYFKLLNSLVFENTNPHKRQSQNSEDLRSFAPFTERILFYEQKGQKTGLENIYSDPNKFEEIKNYMIGQRAALMEAKGFKTISQFNKYINEITETKSVVSRHYFADSQFVFATEEIYKKLQSTGYWKKPWIELKNIFDENIEMYENERLQIESQRRHFDNFNKEGDVIRLSNTEGNRYDHDTIKPEKLTRILINTTTKRGDLVLVPFAGSGTECAMCAKEKRDFIGFDIEKKYVDMANKRVKEILRKPELF